VVRLQGEPATIGFQHGYWLADEIVAAIAATEFSVVHRKDSSWEFLRQKSQELFEPWLPTEYRQELTGIVAGLRARGVNRYDFLDLLALNGYFDICSLWDNQFAQTEKKEGGCSAFIATGSATRDGKIVMAHNTWLYYFLGVHFNLILDVRPAHGHRFLMQCLPGYIFSGPDWAICDSGLMITETTITGFYLFDPKEKPYFLRMRQAMQYADSIDAWVKIMVTHNNGAYANSWLLGDARTGEIARLELGLKTYVLTRTSDGFLAGSNLAFSPEVRRETEMDYTDSSSSSLARDLRWRQIAAQYYGKIDVQLAERLLADHYDTFRKRDYPGALSICGHLDSDSIGFTPGGKPYTGFGAFDGKVTTTNLAIKMQFWAIWGHPCGSDFIAKDYLQHHPEYDKYAPVLRDVRTKKWTLIH